MNVITVTVATAPTGALARLGQAMARHRRAILVIQWTVVVFYLALVTLPAFLPLPGEDTHIWNDLTRLAQFVFWGVWWPFVMLSMMAFGRVWCGVFCPEGALTEFVSRRGLGRAIPRWMRWGGWPFVAFVSTTVYGQLVSVYEYPKAALLVLGGSTVAAVAIGYVYGRGTRVWCRHLCPANGVFRLLARLAPLHFRADETAWKQSPRRMKAVDCAPLVDLRHLRSATACHACGRCSGHRGAVWLTARSPNAEILAAEPVSRWEVALLLFGVLGLATGAFQWSASPWFVALKQTSAIWLIEHEALTLLQDNAPWWLLTHYPEANDVFTWLDGLCILLYLGTYALGVGGFALAMLWLAQKLLGRASLMWRLALALVPLAGASVFLGLSMLTTTQLAAERVTLPWLPEARTLLLGLALAWSAALAARLIQPLGASIARRLLAWGATLVAMLPVATLWWLQFHRW